MRFVRTVRCTALFALFTALALSLPAAAQEEEMDLGGLGLDLTEATMDLRPTLAVVGVDLTEGNPKRDGWVVTYVSTLLASNASKSNLFVSVLKPDEVAEKLGDRHAEALKCVEDACMVELAAALGVERLVTAQLSHGEGVSVLKLNAFTRATLAVETATVEVKGPPRGDFFRKAVVALKPLFQSISGKLARLKVTPSVEEAQVTLGDRELGTGTVDVKVSAGTYALKATADGYRPAQQQVALEEGGSADLQLTLEPVPKRSGTEVAILEAGAGRAAGGKSPGPSLDRYLSHPGTYVGAAGAVALLVGAGVGATAMATQGRAVDADGDGVLDITRNDALAAGTQAVVANVLFAAGAVSLAGGGAWLFVAPPKGGGVAVAAGGKF